MISGETDDRTLVLAAQSGDRGALEALLGRHYGRVHAVCRRLTGSDADADDAAQEAMIRIVRGLDRFDGRAAFGTWAYRIATNASLDELRRRKRRPALHVVPDDGAPAEQEDPRAGGHADATADRLAVDAAISALPDEFRTAVVLRDVADLDYAEIAAVLDVPIGTVKSRIARGRAQLATALGNPAPRGERRTVDHRPPAPNDDTSPER